MPTSLSGVNIILDLNTRTYEQFRTQALELAGTLTPEWTDFYPHDPAVVLTELLSGQADILSYYIDRAFNESMWDTAQTRAALIRQAKLISYSPTPASSSTVTVDVTITGVSGTFTLYGVDSTAGAAFRIGNESTRDLKQFNFELLNEIDILADGVYQLTFIEGKTTFREDLGTSNGAANQVFALANSPVTTDLLGSPAVKIEQPIGTFWEEVSNFQESASTDKHFVFELAPDGTGRLNFGDGVNGAIPTNGLTIYATYRVGGGEESNNITANRITKILNSSTTGTGSVTSVSNTARPTGGQDEESIEQIRSNAPKVFGTQDRAVTHEDYETLARSVTGVFKAKAGWYKGSPLMEAVYIATTGDNPVPTGTWNITKQSGTGLLGVVGKVLVEKSSTATQIVMLPIVAVDIIADITVYALDSTFKANVSQAVKTALKDYVKSTSTVTIPTLRSLSGLYKALEEVAGVDYIDVNTFRREPYIEPYITGLSNTTFSDVSVAGDLEEEVWTLLFTSTSAFTVEGSVTGLQSNTGILGTVYNTDLGQLGFTLTAGSILNKPGDQYQIRTSKTAGNVNFQTHEIPLAQDVNITINVEGGIG